MALEPQGLMVDYSRVHTPHQRIPGERDPDNLTKRQPGAVGGQFTGGDIPADATQPLLDEDTAQEHAREGGSPGRKAKKRPDR